MHNPFRIAAEGMSLSANIEILDVVILQTHTEKFCESLYCFTSSGCTEMLVDHVSNFVSLVRIGRIFERAALRHLLSFGSVSA